MLETSATAGVALVHIGDGGEELLRLACRRQPADLYAALPTFTRIGSEDRLTIGMGDELAVLVVSMEGPDVGLTAVGEPQRAIIGRVVDGRPVYVSYGARQLTLDPPPQAAATAFAEGCRSAG